MAPPTETHLDDVAPAPPLVGEFYANTTLGVTQITKPVQKDDGSWTTRTLDVIPVALQLLGIVEEDGVVTWLRVRKTQPGGTAHELDIPVGGITGTAQSAGEALRALGEVLTSTDAKWVVQWLGEASRNTLAPRRKVLSRAQWQGDTLLVPGLNFDPAPGRKGYGPADLEDEDDSRKAWAEAAACLNRNPKAALTFGAAWISPDLCFLNVPGTVFHPWADAGFGKTQMTEDAQSQFGNPDPGTELRGEWNQTKNAIIDNLATASIMPYMLDETRNAKDTTALSEVPFMVRAGIETGRANLQGRARKLKTFHLNLFSTGESRLSSATGVTGVRRRVIEPAAPLAEQEDADFIHGVAERFYGWPLKWKVEMGPVSEVELEVPVFENKLMNDLARPLAAAALGFQKLCESVDVECTVDYMEVYRELGETLEDEGRAWKRLYDLLVEDRISQNGEYGKSGRYGRNGKDSLYMATDKSAEFLGEYSWAVFPERVKWLAEKIDLSDPTVALKGMKEQGLLSTYEGDSKLTQRVPTGNGNRTRMYVFVVREEDLDGWTNASESVDKLVDSE